MPPRQPEPKNTRQDPSVVEPEAIRRLGLALAVGLVAILPYTVALHGPFLFDDLSIIERNPFVHDLSWWWRWFTHDFWDVSPNPDEVVPHTVYWRPLVLASYALDWQLWYGHPLGFRLSNLFFHLIASGLAFLTLRRWTGQSLPAVAGALLFALHPSKAESVAWIAGRTDTLGAIGVLLACLGVGLRLRRARGGVSLELLGTGIAYGAKETAILLPLLASIETWIHAGRPSLERLDWRRVLRAAGPQLLVAGAYLLGRQLWEPPGGNRANLSSADILVWSVLDGLGRSVRTLVWPTDLSLGSSQMELTGQGDLPFAHAALGAATILALLALAVTTWRRAPTAAVAPLTALAFIAPSLPVAMFGYAETAAPRLLYLPLFAIGWATATVLAAAHPPWRRWAWGLAGLLLAASGGAATVRSLDFTSQERFWRYELAANPNSHFALDFHIARELTEGRPRSALDLAAYASRVSEQTARAEAPGPLVLHSITALHWITPDLDRATLSSLRQVLRDLIKSRPTRLELPTRGIRFELPPESPVSRWLRGERSRLLVYEADFASRLGDDAATVRAVRESLDRCWTCKEHLRMLVIAAARAQDLALAEEVLQRMAPYLSPGEIEATEAFLTEASALLAAAASAADPRPVRARYYTLAGAWGRAYAELAPQLAAAASLPRDQALALGESAFRAGDEPTARQLLSRLLPPAELDTRFETWSRELRWVDAPGRDPLLDQILADADGPSAPR